MHLLTPLFMDKLYCYYALTPTSTDVVIVFGH